MGEVIDLNKWRATKIDKKTSDNSVVNAIRDSLNNEVVKGRYGLKQTPPTEKERLANIRASIDRVNKLMDELRDTTTKGDKTK